MDASLRAIIRVRLLDSSGGLHDVDALIDTGYSHYLTLSPSIILALGLPVIGQNRVHLADGSVQVINTNSATALWEGRHLSIEVDETDTSARRHRMMVGYHLGIKVVSGGIEIKSMFQKV